MPYYAYPSNKSADQGLPPYSEEKQVKKVDFALKSPFITDFLRHKPDFAGYINSETDINAVHRIPEI